MRNIMIVDDEKPMRDKYKKLLKTNGFKVFEAPDGVEVANLLMRESSTLDLIVLDINMPEVDGRDIFDIIEEYAPSIPIVVSSIYPLQDQKLKIPRATEYFQKTQDDEDFLKIIRSVLGVTELQ